MHTVKQELSENYIQFIQKLNYSEKIIIKTGNKKHFDSLNLLKKELKQKE